MPDAMRGQIQPPSKRHPTAQLDGGVESLDGFIRQYAGQNARAGINRTFVAVPQESRRVAGHCALSAGSVVRDHLPEPARQRQPRYPVPVAHPGRLAVAQFCRGERLGEHLLVDALRRVLTVADEMGVHAVEVVATNDAARSFYLRYGFVPLVGDAHDLYLPLKTIRQLGLA